MKIRNVDLNLRQKAFIVTTASSILPYPFSKLNLQPTTRDPIARVYVDPELAMTGFTYVLRSGKEDSVVLDQVLEYNRDPDYLRKMMLHKMTVHARKLLSASKASRREIIRRMDSSPTQFYRLIDAAFYDKTIDQMVRLLSALDCNIDFLTFSGAERTTSSVVGSSNDGFLASLPAVAPRNRAHARMGRSRRLQKTQAARPAR